MIQKFHFWSCTQKHQSRNLNRYSHIHTHSSRWKQPNCPVDGWINTLWSIIHTTRQWSAFKRKEILTQATAWRSHEDIILSEIGKFGRTNTVKFTEPGSRRWFPGAVEGEWRVTAQ
jgi:hypothetical protein